MGWLIPVCIQKPVLCLAGGVKVHLSLGRFWTCQQWPVNSSCAACLWLLACRHHRAMRSSAQDPPPVFAEAAEGNYTPSTSGAAVLAWAPQSTCTARSWWRNRGMCRNQRQRRSQLLFLSRELVWRGHSSKHQNCTWVIVHTGVWLPTQRAGTLGRANAGHWKVPSWAWVLHGKAAETDAKTMLQWQPWPGHSVVVSVPLHLLSQLKPRALRQRNTKMR